MTRPSRRLSLIILVLLILAGFGLRAYHLGAAGIWGDEAWSISFALKPLATILAPGSDTLPPFYQVLLHFWIRAAGDTEFAVRFMSLIPGLLLIPAVYGAGCRLAGRSAGLVAAGLMAVSPFGVAYSQEARMYTLLTFLCALSVYFAARLWEVTNGRAASPPALTGRPLSMSAANPAVRGSGEGATSASEGGEAPPARISATGRTDPALHTLLPLAATYLLVTLAAMYTHFYALLVIAAQDVYVLWLYRRRLTWLARWVAGQIGLGLAFLVWLAPQIAYFAGRAQSRGAALGLDTLTQIVTQTVTAFSIGYPAPAGLSAGLVLMLAAMLAGLLALFRRNQPAPKGAYQLPGSMVPPFFSVKRRVAPLSMNGEGRGGEAESQARPLFEIHPAPNRPFTVLYLLLPILLAWLTGPLLLFFHPRYLMEALPAFLILVAAGIVSLAEYREWRSTPIAAAALAGLVAVSGLSLGQFYASPTYAKSGYREMMAAIRGRSKPGDVIFLLNPEQGALFDYYGDKTLPALTFPAPDGGPDQARLAKVARNNKRIWLVMFGDARPWDPGGDLQNWLNGHAFRAWRDALIDTQVELYVIGRVEPSPVSPVDFGGLIGLEGYGLSSESVSPGDTLQIALAWRSEAVMNRDYTIFTHLIDDQGRVIGQFDGPPMGGTHPTSAWAPGEKNVDRFGILVDPATPPGAYHLEVGWYDLSTLKRILVLDSHGQPLDDRALLVQIDVN